MIEKRFLEIGVVFIPNCLDLESLLVQVLAHKLLKCLHDLISKLEWLWRFIFVSAEQSTASKILFKKRT